ncbi:MAG: hypothetical protein HYR70_08740 [Chloroflexi bacterium]|nr:hypothetical protein [Chloroflexota bacterium]MBI3339083.1 hypothetical protein [Chloroflexota bacterium]
MLLDFIVNFIDKRDQQALHSVIKTRHGIEHGDGTIAKLRKAFSQGSDEVSGKALWFAVKRVERQPAKGQVAVMRQIN